MTPSDNVHAAPIGVAVVEHAAHDIRADFPEVFADLVSTFIMSIEA
jgi:hypothetical protein